MAAKPKARFADVRRTPVPKAYQRLAERFLLRSIENEQELAEATALADELFDRPNLLPEEQKYLDVLCELIERYENEHEPICDVSAAEMLRFLIEQRGVTQQTVSQETKIANSTVTALLKGDRGLTRRHIEIFARYFGVGPAVFLSGNEPDFGDYRQISS
jgi:HTH-type transcriptional regulator/antitoxin HigA